MDDARALLDSLMGSSRNEGPASKTKEHYTDRNVCKFWLIDFCPHECFHTTVTGKAAVNSPLGECPKVHSDFIRQQFKNDSVKGPKRRRIYERDLLKYLKKLVYECDQKRDREKRILESKISETRRRRQVGLGNNEQELEHKIIELKQAIQEKIKKAELLAEDGEFEESQAVMKEVELQKEELQNEESAVAKAQSATVDNLEENFQEDVCDVCGLAIDWRCAAEIENRRKGIPHPHTSGTYHQGYEMIRKKVVELEAKYKDEPEEYDSEDADAPRGGWEREAPRGRGGRDSRSRGGPARGGGREERGGGDWRSGSYRERERDRGGRGGYEDDWQSGRGGGKGKGGGGKNNHYSSSRGGGGYGGRGRASSRERGRGTSRR
eukprot:g17598.t1